MPESYDIPDLKEIIDNADVEVLRTFLWKQARRNSALALKLRAHLVEGIESPASVNKYSQVLGLLVHHNVHGTIRLTRRSIQILRDICDHFVKLQAKYLQEGELRNAWEVGYAVISHLHILMDKYQGPDPKLITILTDCYAHVLELLNHFPAPELKQSIYSALHDIAHRRHHVIYDLNYNAITCLIHATSGTSGRKDISDLILEKLSQTDESQEANRKLWSALLLKIPHALVDYHKHISPEQVYDIAHLLNAAQDSDALSKLLHAFHPPQTLSSTQHLQWAKWKFDLALQSANAKDIRTYGWELLKLDQDMLTYRRIKSATATPFLSAHLSEQDISDELRGEIFAEEQQWDALKEVIRKSSSMPMLIRHCEHLLYEAGESDTLIEEVTHAYAVHHGGPKSIEQIALLMETLERLKQDALASHLAEVLKTDFPGRFDSVLKMKRKRKGQKHPVDMDDTIAEPNHLGTGGDDMI
ncbi:MAG TPA: hypothetical protein VI603_06535 [Saprospiraceae bacterium]|nr:hypothetical protein [Saprospiraceae bacterium]